jgi:ATP-dependent RNA helicase DeaD
VPSPGDILERQMELVKTQLGGILAQGGYSSYKNAIAEFTIDYDALDIAAAALKLFQEGYKENNVEDSKTMDFGNTCAENGLVRLFINAGRQQKIQPQDIVRTIAEEADIEGSIIGVINIYDKFTFVEVPEDVAERVLSVMHKNTIKGYRINIEPAKGR